MLLAQEGKAGQDYSLIGVDGARETGERKQNGAEGGETREDAHA
jgi:hypothetical protein